MIAIAIEVAWNRHDAVFTDSRYSRAHTWSFDGGAVVAASSSPHIVPLPYSRAENVDPEEAFIASLSSCHMLMFLAIAAKAGFVVDRYRDRAVGTMGFDPKRRMIVDTVTLHPEVSWSGKAPSRDEEEAFHHDAHEQCFLANSVRTLVTTHMAR